MTDWEKFTVEELRTAAKVARASGGLIMGGAAAAWELRADFVEQSSGNLSYDKWRFDGEGI